MKMGADPHPEAPTERDMTTTTVNTKPRQREAARPIALMGGPRSPEATALVDHFLQHHVLPARLASLPSDKHTSLGPSGLQKRRKVVGALLADLLDLQADTRPDRTTPAGMHGTSPKDFSVETLGFARLVLLEVSRSMESAGLLRVVKGAPRWQKAFDTYVVRGGELTTYRLTDRAVGLAEERGVPVGEWSKHWRLKGDQTLPATMGQPLLVLRSKAIRVKGKKEITRDLPITSRNEQAGQITTGIKALNDFLATQEVGGIAFPGLRRIFSNGDQPDFAWNKHGRYYSLPGGHSYEVRASEWRRSVITLNGEAVEEVDLRASHLTLLHALMRQPFDHLQDPYAVPDLPRAVVKAWVTQAMGASNPRSQQWSKRAQEDFESERPGQWLRDEYAIREVAAAVKARHPLLVDLNTCGLGPLDLMFHEAEILRLAMEDLMLTQGIAVLPMHDAIIAPRSALREAEGALKRAFSAHVEGVTGHPSMVIPKVTWKGQR